MTISPKHSLLVMYKAIAIIGGLGIIGFAVESIVRKCQLKGHANAILYGLLLFGSSVVTLLLSVYYTLKIDIQSQGRYIIYVLLPLIIVSVLGWRYIISKVPRFRLLVIALIAALYVMNSVTIFVEYIK